VRERTREYLCLVVSATTSLQQSQPCFCRLATGFVLIEVRTFINPL
jgi:hypothetical protein